jgi:hypothetical protein
VPEYVLIVTSVADLDLVELESETGLRCTPDPPEVRIEGELVDRAALHGVLGRIHDAGADLVELRRTGDRGS